MSTNLKKWPIAEDIDRIRILRDYNKIFEGDLYHKNHKETVFALKRYFQNDREKQKVLSIAVNIGSLISAISADYLAGEGFTLRAKDENQSEALAEIKDRNELQRKVYESALSHSFAGYSVFHIRKKDNLSVIEEIPFDHSFPDYTGSFLGEPAKRWVLADWFERTNKAGHKSLYVLKKIYSFNDSGKVILENEVWSADKGTLQQKKKQVLGDFYPDMLETEETTLDKIPVIEIDNIKTVKRRFGTSDYKKILGLLEEINDRFTQLSLQFIKHLTAKIAAPASSVAVDEDGNMKAEDLEVFLMEAGDTIPQYIEYQNPLIEEAFKHIENSIRMIASISQIPQSFILGDEKGGVEKVEALKIRLMNFIKKIRRNQMSYDNGLKKILVIAMEYEGKEIKPKEIEIIFREGFPVDKLMDARTFQAAILGGFMSKEKAIGEFQDLEGEDLIREQQKITLDETVPTFGV